MCIHFLFPRGIVGDFGIHHQRVRHPTKEGAPVVSAEGVDSAAQTQVCTFVPSAAELLHRAVRGEGPGHGDAGTPGKSVFVAFVFHLCSVSCCRPSW